MNSPARGRWRPSRAGILNVYQYEDETLHFAEGRLLLRGVNGSGKSTAMNMLLPFLLEGDTRRIDAAGEQTAVLKSWMLAETDETQRTGYLWLEFQRPDDNAPGGFAYHSIGCGIRANRSADRVTTWWFSTPRRPRIDFSLISERVPLTVEGLRVEIGTEAVFTGLADYRLEISRRFFGGADPSGYLALLHQVRNPRVGDRIDADLPRRLQEALPPVPEGAVADAAQPLEDLEEHRRNVTALERTDRALRSVLETYGSYAQRVVRTFAANAAESVTGARSAAQRRGRLRAASEEADSEQERLKREVGDLEREHSTVDANLAGLVASPAYQQLEALVARQETVATEENRAADLRSQCETAKARVVTAVAELGKRRDRIDGDLASLATDLDNARRHCRTAGIDIPLPGPPQLRLRRIDGLEGPDPLVDPLQDITVTPVADAIRQRGQSVRLVKDLVSQAGQALVASSAARAEAERVQVTADEATALATKARTDADAASRAHRSALNGWAERLAELVQAVPSVEPAGPVGWLAVPVIAEPESTDSRAMATARVEAARAAAQETEATLGPAMAEANLRVRRANQLCSDVSNELAAVRAASELPLPRAEWQHPSAPDAESFASQVDFRDDLDGGIRAGLEAACEAAGLLSATVRSDGAVLVSNGELLLLPAEQVEPNLTALLTPAAEVGADPAVVTRVLSAIGLGAASAAPLWVSDDGRFGAGALRGRHAKASAEYIGVGAREAARRRRISALEAELASAESHRDIETAVLGALLGWLDGLRQLVRYIPSTREVDDTVAASVGAVRDALRATGLAEAARSVAVTAELRAEQAWAVAETTAAQHRLPVTAEALQDVQSEVEESAALVRQLPDRIGAARRSFQDWTGAFELWEDESAGLEQAAEDAERADIVARQARNRLDAVEAALGDEPQRVAAKAASLETQKGGLEEDLRARRSAHTASVSAAATARADLLGADEQAERMEKTCALERDRLRAVLAVDGLLSAASDGKAEPLPDVPDTVDGTARLVAAVREAVPEPARDVTEDALDRSLRQIRDSLGAGWDAGSRRARDGAPVAVEVSGPYGRRALPDAAVQVATDLRRARGLLTTQQDQALRNLLHGRVAREVAKALFAANELVRDMNLILGEVRTSQGIGVRLEWRTRDDLDQATATALRLLAKDPDARSETEDAAVRTAVTGLVEDARAADPDLSYRDVIGSVLDYRTWHELKIFVRRPGRADERLRRRTQLSEGEKKLVTYLPMAAAASASAAAHDPYAVGAPRLILLDDAFAKVSEDNHERLFGLLVGLDLDFIVTSERLFGTHASVPELSIVEVLRDPDLRTIALIHYHWDGRRRTERVPR